MATKHGNKIYLQILLDPAKAALLEEQAKGQGVKTSALAREAIYFWLRSVVEPSAMEAADSIDDENRKQSHRNRAEGRKRAKQLTAN